jgi:predicted nucleic acid-binding protein
LIATAVVDTDVASFIFKRDTRAAWYKTYISGKICVLSFQTVAELEQWSELRAWGQRRRAELDSFLQTFVTVESDRDLCKVWGRIGAQARQQGRPIDSSDAWIAATAIKFGAPLVTHNSADYRWVAGLTVVSQP